MAVDPIHTNEALHLEAELDRARRIGMALSNPTDVTNIHRYIAELEGRMRLWIDDQGRFEGQRRPEGDSHRIR